MSLVKIFVDAFKKAASKQPEKPPVDIKTYGPMGSTYDSGAFEPLQRPAPGGSGVPLGGPGDAPLDVVDEKSNLDPGFTRRLQDSSVGGVGATTAAPGPEPQPIPYPITDETAPQGGLAPTSGAQMASGEHFPKVEASNLAGGGSASLAGPAAPGLGGEVKLGDIDGESTDTTHKIEVLTRDSTDPAGTPISRTDLNDAHDRYAAAATGESKYETDHKLASTDLTHEAGPTNPDGDLKLAGLTVADPGNGPASSDAPNHLADRYQPEVKVDGAQLLSSDPEEGGEVVHEPSTLARLEASSDPEEGGEFTDQADAGASAAGAASVDVKIEHAGVQSPVATGPHDDGRSFHGPLSRDRALAPDSMHENAGGEIDDEPTTLTRLTPGDISEQGLVHSDHLGDLDIDADDVDHDVHHDLDQGHDLDVDHHVDF